MLSGILKSCGVPSKTTTLDVAGGCLGTYHGAKKNFVSQGTLDTIEGSCKAVLNGRAELFRELRHKTAVR